MLDSNDTKIGLPEVKLGILPGFGGSLRLPRLIGLPAALDIILKGRLVRAQKALQIGLADKLVTEKFGNKEATFRALELTASDLALGKLSVKRRGPSMLDRVLTSTALGRGVVKKKAMASVLKETKGHYPAPVRALEVAIEGLEKSIADGFAMEAKGLGELIVTSQSKSLVHLYFLTEASSKLGRAAGKEVKAPMVTVVGGGVMGAGIAATCLGRGSRVVVVELNEEARSKAAAHIKNAIGAKRGITQEERDAAIERLLVTESLDAATGSEFVIEAIIEDLGIKQKLFTSLAACVNEESILASNTSSLSISEISSVVPNAGRCIGMHFFNPAEKMPLVEIVRSKDSSDRTTFLTAAFAASLGKYPVIVEDVPGFLVNRILSLYLAEAGQLLFSGIPIEVIDRAASDFGMPMGPIRLLDEVGLDVAAKVQSIMIESYGERMKAPDFLSAQLEAKRFGKKSGLGFYRYEGEDAVVDSEVYSLLGITPSDKEDFDKAEIQDRLMLCLVNEAVRCLDEGVAGLPGEDAAGQIDLATVMGTGFAPFRGGVLKYADTLGPKAIRTRMRGLEKLYGPRFAPCEGIVTRAEKEISFYQAIP